MGTVFNRGTKDNPNWYVGYRENGRWVYKASRQPTKALAKRWVSEIESRVARGTVGSRMTPRRRSDELDAARRQYASRRTFGRRNAAQTTPGTSSTRTCASSLRATLSFPMEHGDPRVRNRSVFRV
jgi:hypothetical protein